MKCYRCSDIMDKSAQPSNRAISAAIKTFLWSPEYKACLRSFLSNTRWMRILLCRRSTWRRARGTMVGILTSVSISFAMAFRSSVLRGRRHQCPVTAESQVLLAVLPQSSHLHFLFPHPDSLAVLDGPIFLFYRILPGS